MGTEPVPSPMNGHPRELVVVPWPFRDPTGFYTDVWAALNSSMKPPVSSPGPRISGLVQSLVVGVNQAWGSDSLQACPLGEGSLSLGGQKARKGALEETGCRQAPALTHQCNCN